MHAVIAGCGRLGSGVARVLSMEGNDVAVVDTQPDRRRLGPDFDGITVAGDPMDPSALESAGIRKASVFVAATADDNVNAAAVHAAKGLFSIPLAIARFVDPEREAFYREMGYQTICPTSTGINQILDCVRGEGYEPLRSMLDTNLVCVIPSDAWLGMALEQVALPPGRRIVAIIREGKALNASEHPRIMAEDSLVVARIGSGKPCRRY